MTQSQIPRVAMCVLRVESRGAEGIQITITTSSDISVPAPGHTRAVAETDEALQLVADFLRAYQEDTAQ